MQPGNVTGRDEKSQRNGGQKIKPGIFLIDTLSKKQNKKSVAPFARIQMGQLKF
jgi:hypothetical protein